MEKAISHLSSEKLIDGKDVVKELSEKMGRHPTNIRAALRGEDKYLTYKFIKTFCLTFGNGISADWIWNGEGEMLQDTPKHAERPMPVLRDAPEPIRTKPRIPTMAAAGALSEYMYGYRLDELEMTPVIQRMPDYDFTIMIKGDSMEPKFEGGDEIAIKRVYNVIEWGHPYVLDTKDGAVLKRIADARMPSGSLQRVKDRFLIQCYTGLSYSDLMDLNIGKMEVIDGTTAIVGNRRKTGEPYTIAVLPEIRGILDKYGWEIPRISDEQYNVRLKVLAEMAGIGKRLSSHWARRTFACMMINRGVRAETLAKMMGHADMRTTMEFYARMKKTTVVSEMLDAMDAK